MGSTHTYDLKKADMEISLENPEELEGLDAAALKDKLALNALFFKKKKDEEQEEDEVVRLRWTTRKITLPEPCCQSFIPL